MGAPDRYEKDIVDKLWAYERESKGELRQLATVEVDGRQLPFVAFTTGGEVVVTARHHIYESWGPTETVMRLAGSGQEGLTFVPVVDILNYAKAESRITYILNYKGGSWASALIYDLYRGYKEGPPSNAENDWPDYQYTGSNSPPHIAAIKRLISSCTLFIDLNNWAGSNFFSFTVPTAARQETAIFDLMTRELQRGSRGTTDEVVQEFRDIKGQTALDYAASLGRINLGLEMPVFNDLPNRSGWPQLRDVQDLVDITAGTISSLARCIA